MQNATQYYNTETVLLIFPFLQTNIAVQTRPRRLGEGRGGSFKRRVDKTQLQRQREKKHVACCHHQSTLQKKNKLVNVSKKQSIVKLESVRWPEYALEIELCEAVVGRGRRLPATQ